MIDRVREPWIVKHSRLLAPEVEVGTVRCETCGNEAVPVTRWFQLWQLADHKGPFGDFCSRSGEHLPNVTVLDGVDECG